MSETSKPVVGKVVLSSGSAKPAMPIQVVQAPVPVLTPDQFAALQHTLIVSSVVAGYLASGKLVNSTEAKRQVGQAIRYATERVEEGL